MKKLLILFSAILLSLNIANAQTWTHYTNLSSDVIAIAIDNGDNKWFGTYGGGISKFDGSTWITYTTANGLCDNNIIAIAVDKHNNIWAGSAFGLSKFNGTNWTTYTTADGLINNNVKYIFVDVQNNTWIGTENGVSKFDGVNWTNYTTSNGLGANDVLSIAADFQGNIWFGTYGGGLSKFDGTNWTNYTTVDGLGSDFIFSVAVDFQDNIWCGPGNADNEPISKFDGTNFTTYAFPFVSASGVCGSIATDIQGNKWIGTVGDISKFDGISWVKFFFNDGIIIAIDAKGNKWFGIQGDGVWELSDGGAGPVNSASIIIGSIFFDTNGNGVWDNGEAFLTGKMVEVLNDSIFYTTQTNGSFYIPRDTGTYKIRCIPESYWQFTTDSVITVVVSDTSKYINNINFGIKMRSNASDVSVDIAGQNLVRAGRDVKYWLTYKNEATLTQNGNVTLKIDTLTSFVSSLPPPDVQSGNNVTWNYTNLVSLEQRQIQLYLHVSNTSHLGDILTTSAIINPVAGDMSINNNYDTLKSPIIGSYDPNDKIVDKGTGSQGYTLFNEELVYTIRFQNTGTDTAFTVQIRDTINSNMDIASLRILSSSHNVRLDVKGQNIVTFIFDNILLPDSTVNEPASIGFVKFAIKPKPGLAENTVVTNKADIYFDFNPPVVTNNTINTYISVLPLIEGISSTDDSQFMALYPNPVSNNLTIVTPQQAIIEITDIQGQLIKTLTSSSGKTNVNVSAFPGGIYIIKAFTEKGIEVKKFVKE